MMNEPFARIVRDNSFTLATTVQAQAGGKEYDLLIVLESYDVGDWFMRLRDSRCVNLAEGKFLSEESAVDASEEFVRIALEGAEHLDADLKIMAINPDAAGKLTCTIEPRF